MRKTTKLIVIAAVFIAVLFTAGVVSAGNAETDYSIVRAKLSIGSVTSLNVTLDGNYTIEGAPAIKLTRSRYTVKLSGSTVSLSNSSGTTLLSGKNYIRFIYCKPTDGKNNFMTVGTKNYQGDMLICKSSTAAVLQCINYVYMEDYLPSVIAAEIGESSNLEALKAQAVAARTYAANEKSSATAYTSYDVVDTASSQVYNGYTPSYTKSISAVNATSKQILTAGNEVVGTYFSASNGGFIELPQHIWSRNKLREPWEVTRIDTYDLAHTSSKKEEIKLYKDLTKNKLPVNFEKYLKAQLLNVFKTSLNKDQGFAVNLTTDIELHQIIKIEPGKLRTGGSDTSTDEEHSTNPSNLCKNHPTSAFNFSQSSMIDNCPNYSEFYFTVNLVAAKIIVDEQSGKNVTIKEPVELRVPISVWQLYTGGAYPEFKDTSVRIFIMGEEPTYFTLAKVRFGHGVGLSQRGTQQQANQGRNYETILDFYFPNSELKQAKITAPVLQSIESEVTVKPPIVGSGYSTANLNVRSSPNSTAPIVGVLSPGEYVEVVALATDGYFTIWYQNALAYVDARYLETEALPVVIATGRLNSQVSASCNVRSTPNSTSSANIVGQHKKTDEVKITKFSFTPDWHQILFNNKIAYIWAAYVDVANQPVTGVSLPAKFVVAVGKTLTVTPTITPAGAANKTVTFTSADTETATIDNAGKLIGVKIGETKITVVTTDGAFTASADVTVKAEDPVVLVPITSLEMWKSAYSLKVGERYQITPKIAPSNATNKALEFVSTDTNIVEIDGDGWLNAKKSGTVTITATAKDGSNKKCSAKVTITDSKQVLVTSIAMWKSTYTLNIGERFQLTPKFTPTNATNKVFSFESTDSAVVSVDANGWILGLKTGTVTITAKTTDGSNKTTSATIKVGSGGVLVTSIAMWKSSYTLKIGAKFQLTPKIAPTNATNQKLNFVSSDTSIVTVDANGWITGKKAGTVTITATTTDGSKKSTKCTVVIIK